MSWLQQRLNQKNLAHATWPRPATTTAKAEKASFALRQSIQELEATLRDQQQESRMWQKRLDLVLDQVLSNECIEDKDDAQYAGKGLHWVPSSRCTLCHRIRTSLQEPMPEHAPRFKTPCPIIKTKKTPLKKNVRSPVHHHYSSSHAFRSTRSTPPTLVDAEAVILGQSMRMHVHTIAGLYHHVLRDTHTVYLSGSHRAPRDMGETEQMVDLVSSLGKNLLLCDVTTGQ